MLVFQVVFGLTIFTITRDYYIDDSNNLSASPVIADQSTPKMPNPIPAGNSKQIYAATFGQANLQDPVDVANRANEFFANRQYVQAADLYQRLLVLDPDNVETYNNLGLTLHYLGKSSEALRNLNEGIAVDPKHQRIWLTLGFVNSQLGNISKARTALETSTQISPDSDIGKTAAEMLVKLP